MKRFVSVLLCLCMVLMCVTPAFAAETDAEEMKAALLAVKNRIDIPSYYSQFEYSSSMANGDLMWMFEWTNPAGGGMTVRADRVGRIIRYEVYGKESSNSLPPKMTKAEAIDAAKKLLSKTHPEIADKLVFDSVNVYRYRSTYSIYFVREEYGVPVTEQRVCVEMNYRTGECTLIGASSLVYDAEIKAPGALVKNDVIFSRWEEMANLTLEYTISSKGKLWYNVKGDIRPINAETGEIIPEDVLWEKNETEDSVTSGGGGGGASNETFRDQLTPEEEEKNQELAGLISKEKADAVVRSYSGLALGKNDSLYSSYLYRDMSAYGEGKRSYWRLEYSGPVTKGVNPNHAYACVDAKTGELLSFRAYGNNAVDTGKIGEITAKANAKAALKSIAPELLGKTDDGVRTYFGTEKTPAEYCFRFGRVENGISVSNNQITVSVSASSGKVTEYTRTWTENVKFEDPSKAISLEKAHEILRNYQEPKVEYYTQTVYLYDEDSESETVDWYYSGIPTRKKITLAYMGPENIRSIDAINGDVDAWSSLPKEGIDTYSDIKGHFAEREIQILLDIGILPAGVKFEPNRQVTQLDLLYFMLAEQVGTIDGKVNVDELYRVAIERGVITAGDRAPSKLVTRAEAARMVVRCTEFAEIAKNPNIFKCDYRDAASIPKRDLGYVVVAKALGIMQGNGGMFRPNHVMTRGEAVCMIFKYLAVKG